MRESSQGFQTLEAFRVDQIPGTPDVILVLEHQFAGIGPDTVQRPGVLMLFQVIKEVLVTGNSIPQAQSGSSKELGYTPEDHQIIKIFYQGDSSNILHGWGKFHIGFINHNKDPVFFADLCHDLKLILRKGR